MVKITFSQNVLPQPSIPLPAILEYIDKTGSGQYSPENADLKAHIT